ncbi:MAG TPA: MOSC N-terminal beta barrel domain-containing protein [Ferruginibacter sp.]|nr:MOSC N-terminal beta barrel domain-containing protein [Ferruginibacter sp.]
MMDKAPCIKRICIYPVKALDGICLQKAQIGPGGSLQHDREYAIIDENGKYVNGKKNPLVHLLRMNMNFEKNSIAFKQQQQDNWHAFHLQNEKTAINNYLSAFFKKTVSLQQNTLGGFLDIPVKSGMTLLSTASLQTVAGWFDNIPLDETRQRFRATLELDNVSAFWEDRLFAEEGTAIEFTIGDVKVLGMSPRARCVVPTRQPQTGESIHAFQKTFVNLRNQTLPAWSALNQFEHAYYLSVDCLVPATETGKWVSIGDEVKLSGNKISAATLQANNNYR